MSDGTRHSSVTESVSAISCLFTISLGGRRAESLDEDTHKKDKDRINHVSS